MVSKDGNSIDPNKINANSEWLVPKNETDMRSFMGITSYYRKLIKGFFKIPYHTTSLHKKDKSLSGLKSV